MGEASFFLADVDFDFASVCFVGFDDFESFEGSAALLSCSVGGPVPAVERVERRLGRESSASIAVDERFFGGIAKAP